MDPEFVDILAELAEIRSADFEAAQRARPSMDLMDFDFNRNRPRGGTSRPAPPVQPTSPLGTTPGRIDVGTREGTSPRRPPTSQAVRDARKAANRTPEIKKLLRRAKMLKGGAASLGVMALYQIASELASGNERTQASELAAILENRKNLSAFGQMNPVMEMEGLAAELEQTADAEQRLATISPIVREVAKSGIPARSIQELISSGGFS